MIIHYHYSINENSGEIRRIRNIDNDVASQLTDKIIEIAFISPAHYLKRKHLHFTLSKKVIRKYYIPMIPFSHSKAIAKWLNSYWMSIILFFICIKYKPTHVIGEYNICYQSFLFGPNKPIFIIDCHGDTKDEYIYNCHNNANKRIIAFFDKMEQNGVKRAKYIICQSKAMKKLLLSRYNFLNPDNIYVYQCNADLSRFYVDDRLRFQYRKQLNLNDSQLLFIYSGGLHKWQKVKESLIIFSQFNQASPTSKFLILTLDTTQATELANTCVPNVKDKIIIRSAPHEEVCGFLNAADIAFLLRDNVILNAVASPTKLDEYMACGLPVISSEVSANWIDSTKFIFNIDKSDINTIPSFIKDCNKQEISSFAKEELSLEKDKRQLAKLIHDEISK